MVLPHPDLPMINPVNRLGSRSDYNVYLGFHSKRDCLLPFLYLYICLIFPYIKIYCLKCRRVTETQTIATAMSRNGRLMRRGQCFTCGKIKPQFVKKQVADGSFLNTLVNKFPFEIHLPGHNFTGSGTKLYERLNPDGTQK